MQNELINTYLSFKKKTLLSYALTFYKTYDKEDNTLWKNEEEFTNILKGIINVYVNKYYLRTKKELNELNVENLKKEEFLMTLSLAIISDYFKDDYAKKIKEHKKNIYDLTVIIYIVTNIDKKITFYKKGSVAVKNIVNQIKDMFNEIFKKLDVTSNPFLIDVLANKVKDVERKEHRFFELIKGEDFYNDFSLYDKDTYYISFNYDLSSLTKFNKSDAKRVYERYNYKERYIPISYEQASITILKCFVNDIEVPGFILPVTTKYLTNKKNLEKLLATFSNPYIKEKVSFSLNYNDYKNNYKKIKPLRDHKFDIVLFLGDDEFILDYSYIKFDYKLFVTKAFVENNPRFNNFVETGKVNYKIIDSIEEYIKEDELISLYMNKEEK